MKRIAAELGAGTMALYYYVRNKADIVALMQDAIFEDVLVPAAEFPSGWRDAVALIARRTGCARRPPLGGQLAQPGAVREPNRSSNRAAYPSSGPGAGGHGTRLVITHSQPPHAAPTWSYRHHQPESTNHR
jgi:AcrR family transcriptional regulator